MTAVSEEFLTVEPNNLDAEQAVLGATLYPDGANALAEALDIVRPGDFYRPQHETILNAIIDLDATGAPIDPITLAAHLGSRGELGRVGGAIYLHTLMSTVTTTASVGYHARIVADLAVRRRLLAAGHRIVQLAGSATSDVDAVTAEAEAALAGVTDTRGTTFQRLEDLVGPTLDTLEGLSSGGPGQGIRTGFIDLDRLLNGLHPGQVIVIGGRPGGGKSTFGLDLLRACAVKQDLPAAFFSFEMGAEEIVMRLLSAEARVPLHLMRSGGMDDGAWSRLSQRMGEVSVAPLFIDDSPNMTMSDVRAKARRLVHRHGVKLICIDYLQLVTTGRKTENRQQEVSEMSRAFKLLAKELQVPILLLSQLNRGSEQRTDKRPMLSDLRESGAVEQDADVVILLHRPDMHDPDDRPGEADLIVAKQRNGATGTLPVVFQGSYSRFVDFAS